MQTLWMLIEDLGDINLASVIYSLVRRETKLHLSQDAGLGHQKVCGCAVDDRVLHRLQLHEMPVSMI